MTTNEERDVLELAEKIGNHVAAEYEDDPGLDGLILELRAAIKPRSTSRGIDLVAVERARQVSEEGYDAEHDRGHEVQIVRAGQSYTMSALLAMAHTTMHERPFIWPWARHFWKPTGDPVRDLVKAGALIAAAIDALTPTDAGSES